MKYFLNFFFILLALPYAYGVPTWLEPNFEDEFNQSLNMTDSDLEDSSCSPIQSFKDITDLVETKCSRNFWTESNRCKCLNKVSEKNELVESRIEDPGVLDDLRDKQKARYQLMFKDIYARMTIESGVQEKILGISPEAKGKLVTCDPAQLANGIQRDTTAIYAGFRDKFKEYVAKAENALKDCQEKVKKQKRLRCGRESRQLVYARAKLFEAERTIKENSVTQCSKTASAFETMTIQDRLKEAADYYRKVGDQQKLKVAEKAISDLKKAHFSVEHEQKEKRYREMKKEAEATEQGAAYLKPRSQCMMPTEAERYSYTVTSNATAFLEEFEEKIQPDFRRESQCDDVDEAGLCKAFENINTMLARKAASEYAEPAESADDCVSRAEFDVYKGLPSEDLLKSLSRGADALDPLTKDKATQQFLRSNPLMAKLATMPNSRALLTSKMKEVANKMKSAKSESAKLAMYLDFMQGPVKKMLDGREMKDKDAYICNQMIRDFASIQASDDLSISDLLKSENDDKVTGLFKDIDRCNVMDNNLLAASDWQKQQKVGPIMSIAQDYNQSRKNRDEEYKEFKEKYCKDFKQYKAKNCTAGMKPDQCRRGYLAGTELATFTKTLDQKNVKSSLRTADVMDIHSHTDRSRRDQSYWHEWDREVRSKMDPNPLAHKGRLDQYMKRQGQDMAMAESANIESSDNKQNSDPSSAPSGGGKPSSSPGSSQSSPAQNLAEKQFVPDFKQNPLPSFDKEKLRGGSPIEKAIPALAGKSPTEQVELLENFKQNLSGADQDLVPKLEEAQELAQAQIPEVVEEVDDKEKETDKEGKDMKSVARTNAGVASGNGGVQRSQGSGVSGPNLVATPTASRVDLTRVAKKDKTLEQLNRTLIDINEKGENVQGRSNAQTRGPASVNEIQVTQNTPAIVVEAFAEAKDLPKTDAGVLIVRDENLEIKDNYNEIVNDRQKLSAFVRSSLVGEQVGPEVIRITDAKSGLQTLLLVNPSKHGLNIKRVDRIATYKGLIYANSAAVPQTP